VLESTRKLVAILVLLNFTVDGCKTSKPSTSESQAASPSAQSTAPSPPAQAATLNLDDLVASIALYPDQLLGQMLIAATNSQEVLDLGNWLIQNQSLKPDAAPAAAKQAGFSASAQYLAAFPQVVDNMCQEMDWTKQLGDTYKADPKGVMDAIQRKRTQAQQQGNLQSSPQMAVDSKTDNGKQVIEIKPANPEVVYVPQYNAQTVYTTPAPAAPAQTTVVEQKSGVSTGTAVAIGLLSFGVGMAVGSAFHHDDYYPYPSWGYGGMYYGGRPYYPPPYRAPVYAGYRPAYGYRPPSNYRWNQYNRNVNVRVNNNNYYNRFNNGGANRGNNGYVGASNNNAPGRINQPAGRGSSGYLGARPQGGANERPGASMARANPAVANRGTANEARPNLGGATRNTSTATRNTPAISRPTSRPNAPNPGNGTGNRPTNLGSTRTPSGAGDRGFGGGNAAQNRSAIKSSPSVQNRPSSNGGAFGGDNHSGKSERAASNRGRSSMDTAAPSGGGRRRR
jgi:hypothetical protein